MKNPKKHWLIGLLQAVLIFLLLLLNYSGLLKISSINAVPLLILPFFISFCMFCSEIYSVMTGLLIGIFMDSAASTGSVFHAVFFSAAGFFISLFIHYLLNNNFKSAVMLSLIATLIYFILRWLFFHAFKGNITDSLEYLVRYAVPSVIYTNLFIFPFYFLQSYLNKFKTKQK